jgi:uncharacterized BrkB/YihY/UPF0761 family membrane protein
LVAPRRRRALTGALWLIVSGAFRLYLHLFGGNPVFGVLGGARVVLLWLYLLSLGLLIGAELNAVLAERRARPALAKRFLSSALPR